MKKIDLIRFFTILFFSILAFGLSTFLSFRIDLTQDKRFSLNTSTIKLLKNIQDPMLFTIYLDGDFPSGFQRLKLESLRLLEEFRAENPNIKYILVNPSENSDSQARRDTYTQLKNSGLSAIQIKVEEQDGVKEQQIFPGAIVSYQDKEWPVSLLMDQFASNPEAQINASIQNLEYSLATSENNLPRFLGEKRSSESFLNSSRNTPKKSSNSRYFALANPPTSKSSNADLATPISSAVRCLTSSSRSKRLMWLNKSLIDQNGEVSDCLANLSSNDR